MVLQEFAESTLKYLKPLG